MYKISDPLGYLCRCALRAYTQPSEDGVKEVRLPVVYSQWCECVRLARPSPCTGSHQDET